MIITANKAQSPQQQVNTVGKYLYKNLDGAFDYAKSSNMYDVYTIVLYQVPVELAKKYGLSPEQSDVREMVIDLNITTYADKIRFNVIEQDPHETTLGCKVCTLSRYKTLDDLRADIMAYLKKKLEARYEGFDFLF